MNHDSAAGAAAPRKGVWSGLSLVLLAGIIWGTIGPAVQLTHEDSGLAAWTISSYRAAAALAALILIVIFTGRLRSLWRLGRLHWRRATAVGGLTAMFQFLFLVATVWAGVSVTTVVALGSAPTLLLILGSIRQRRVPSFSRVATLVIAITGLLLISLVGGGAAAPPHPVLGTITAVLAGAAYGYSTEVAAPLTQRVDIFTVTIVTLFIATVILIPAGLLLTLATGGPMFTTNLVSGGWISYLGIVTMVLAYALFYAGLRSTPSGIAVLATLIEPVTAVVIAVLFISEQLSVAGVVGVVLILVAIATISRQDDA